MKHPKRKTGRTAAELTGRAIDAMTPAQRQKIIDELERSSPEQRDVEYSAKATQAEQARMKRFARKLGRPKLSERGTRAISITVEAELLDLADAFARTAGMKRSELFSEGLRRVLGSAGQVASV